METFDQGDDFEGLSFKVETHQARISESRRTNANLAGVLRHGSAEVVREISMGCWRILVDANHLIGKPEQERCDGEDDQLFALTEPTAENAKDDRGPDDG